MKIAILGFAGQGQAAYDYWNKPENEITIRDKDKSISAPAGVITQLGPDYLKNLDQYDLLVRTPALHPRDIVNANPKSPDILDKVTTVTNEFFKVCPTKNIIGVTGTKGKGTTSTLIAKILEAAGKKVHLGGNIGIPPPEMLKNGIQPDDWVVLELANYQLIDLKHSPHIAVCLMVEPEHMDWHIAPMPAQPHRSKKQSTAPGDPIRNLDVPSGTPQPTSETPGTTAGSSSSYKDEQAWELGLEEYIAAKQQLFIHQSEDDIAIYYAKNENSLSVADASESKQIPYFAPPGAFVENDDIVIDGQSICATSELKLLGQHNWQNVCAAVTTAWQITQDVEAIRSVLTTFTGLEHRLELVRELDGVKYYDDSFGTTPETAIVATEALDQPKVIILGGSDKGAKFDALAQTIAGANIRQVILIGNTTHSHYKTITPDIESALKAAGVTTLTSTVKPGGITMEKVVQLAREHAQTGDVVLLSTACASFDMFKNYKDRGEQFKQAVQALS